MSSIITVSLMLIDNFLPIDIPFKIGQYVNIMDTADTNHNNLDSLLYHITCNHNSGSNGVLIAISQHSM